MKRTLSLILALAMIMSLFTTVSFADDVTLAGDAVKTVTCPGAITEYNKTSSTLTVYHVGDFALAADSFTAVENDADKIGAASEIAYDDAEKKLTFTATPKDGEEAVTYTVAVKKEAISFAVKKVSGTATWTEDKADKTFYFMAADGTTAAGADDVTVTAGAFEVTDAVVGTDIKVTEVNKTGDNVVDGIGTITYDTGYDVISGALYTTMKIDAPTAAPVTFPTKVNTWTVTTAPSSGEMPAGVTFAEGKFSIADASAVTSGEVASFENVAVKKSDVPATAKVYVELNVTKLSADFEVEIHNGSYVEYNNASTSKSLLKKIASEIKTDYKLSTTPTLTGVSFTFPKYDAGKGLKAYDIAYASNMADANWKNKEADYAVSLDADDKLTIVAAAGKLGAVEVAYTASAEGGASYTGKITFESVVAGEKKATQGASFSREWFYLDSISGLQSIVVDGDTYNPETSYMVDPKSHSADWELETVGYDSKGVLYDVEVKFTHSEFDLQTAVEDGGTPFVAEQFEEFLEAVNNAQADYYAVSLEKITIERTSNSTTGSKWALKRGNASLTKMTPAQLESVTMDVTNAGVYDIPFTLYYNFKSSSGAAWTTAANNTVKGTVRVYAGNDGDIQYEVFAGDYVKFDVSDFQKLYEKLTGSSKNKKLSSVTIDALPMVGTLYHSGKQSNAYKVSADDTFEITNTVDEISKLSYWAYNGNNEKYSVYIPVTMSGTGGTKTAVVEILVNTGMPFTDIAKGSTFYEYINYCYKNEIMGGKSATYFDAKSNITRAQLVVTLYRMEGSPATYNSRVLPFTDTAGLNTEFTNALKWATAKGIVNGYGDKFNPNSAVTRQAMVTILYRYAKNEGFSVGVEYDKHLGSYADGGKVSAAMTDAMNWAVDYGLISGNGNKLNPGGSTTRGAAAKILANFHSSYLG